MNPTTDLILRVPHIYLSDGTTLFVAGKRYNARCGSIQEMILRYFAENISGVLTLNQLMDMIMGGPNTAKVPTITYLVTSRTSAMKSISRLRLSLARHFEAETPKCIEWLHFSEAHGGWILYKFPGYGSDRNWHK